MCGIAGIIRTTQASVEPEVLRKMSACVAHRGPDSSGEWFAPGVGFAHQRLAIIDLNPTGAQPMTTMDGRYTIIFNGEIYNYRELKKELESHGSLFQSSSDTEVLLHGFSVWGVDFVSRLRGMFAFAIWDTQTSSLFVARDRVGKKPFYYRQLADGFAFASEISALSVVGPMKPSMSDVRLFLGLQYVPAPRTGYEEIFQLPIGSYGEWKDGVFVVTTYHTWEASPETKRTTQELDDQIRARLDDAVKVRQLASDVPVGVFLSGGIDSSAIAVLASKHLSAPLQTFTVGFDSVEHDERDIARKTSEMIGSKHHEFVATPEDLLAFADELITHYGLPYADSSALPTWLLARETSKHVKVVLTGDGGDEAFGGYRRYVAYQRAKNFSYIPGAVMILRLLGKIRNDARYDRMATVVKMFQKDSSRAYGEMFTGSYFQTAELQELCEPEFFERTRSHDAVQFIADQMHGKSSLDDAMLFDLSSYVPDDLNVKMDRASMRWGLEARAPFLDQELLAFIRTIPEEEKVSKGKTKVALRRAMKGIVPEHVLSLEKKGFQIPLAEWFRGPLASVFEERCMSSGTSLSGICRPETVKKIFEENKQGKDHGNRLWMLYALATWLEK